MATTWTREWVSYNGAWVPFVTLPTTAVQPPTNFSGQFVGLDNILTWTDSITLDADGYDIYWSTTSLTDWTTGTLLGNYAPGVETATHVGGQSIGDIYYGIAARRGAEVSTWKSAVVKVPYAVYYDWKFDTDDGGWDLSGTSRNTFTWYPGYIQWVHTSGSLADFGYCYSPQLEKGDQVGEGIVAGSSYYFTASFQLISNALPTEFPQIDAALYLGGSFDDVATSDVSIQTFTSIGQILSYNSSADPAVAPSSGLNTPHLQMAFMPAHENGYQAAEIHLLDAAVHNMDGSIVYHMVYP